MLYDSFRIMMMICAAMGVIHMVGTESHLYIFFPIVILIWGIYSMFDENDKEYIRRNGFFDDEEDTFTRYDHTSTYQGYRGRGYSQYPSYPSYTPQRYNAYESKKYEHIAKKCNRNFKITIDKDG